MKSIYKVALLLWVCLLSGCITTPKDPNLTTDMRWIGGAISLEARKLDENTYQITARGAGNCKEAQVMKAWIYMADKMAAGRMYDKTTKAELYDYTAPGPFAPTNHTGIMIIGQISLH